MSYYGQCQDLGFICDWQIAADTRDGAVESLVEHINRVHGTGATSPALSALIGRHVIDQQEHAS